MIDELLVEETAVLGPSMALQIELGGEGTHSICVPEAALDIRFLHSECLERECAAIRPHACKHTAVMSTHTMTLHLNSWKGWVQHCGKNLPNDKHATWGPSPSCFYWDLSHFTNSMIRPAAQMPVGVIMKGDGRLTAYQPSQRFRLVPWPPSPSADGEGFRSAQLHPKKLPDLDSVKGPCTSKHAIFIFIVCFARYFP